MSKKDDVVDKARQWLDGDASVRASIQHKAKGTKALLALMDEIGRLLDKR